MKKIKIYIHYNITDKPWGGGNSFLKAFRDYIRNHKKDHYKVVNKITKDCDIFFMNGGHKGQGVYLDLAEIKEIKNKKRLFQKNKRKIIYRLDGARYKYIKEKSVMDELQYEALQYSDFVIFQSQECLESFAELGYNKNNYVTIHNGVNQQIFNTYNKSFWDKKEKLKVFSCNWSANLHKGYKTIAKFSENENVESHFVGRWNNEVDPKNVKILPPMEQKELANYYKKCDVFLHPAQNDPCPNVVLEAMSSGLPVIYHNSGGTPEIASKYGICLPDVINNKSIDAIIKDLTEQYDRYVKLLKDDSEFFSINNVAEKYLSIFNKVILDIK